MRSARIFLMRKYALMCKIKRINHLRNAMSKHRIRTVRTASGAIAVQVVWYENHKTKIAKHLGSAKNAEALERLRLSAKQYIAEYEPQLSLFPENPFHEVVAFDHIEAIGVSHQFARTILLLLAKQCGLGELDALYLDLVIMRIIEPCSKRRSFELLKHYFDISYTRYAYEQLPALLNKQALIESAAIETAKRFNQTFALLLYDVTTLYFETHKPDDDLLARGFSKDDKSNQPQIVIGLLVTGQGFPLLHEVFKGNTFEGHTMLSIVSTFQQQYATEKPIIVADSAMLSQENRQQLDKEGYHYIVGARLANAKPFILQTLHDKLIKCDGTTLRISCPDAAYELICAYSSARYKKDRRELDKQIEKAKSLIARNEPGRRAKFVKKSGLADKPYLFDEALQQKTELLLGVKGYCTNIPENRLSNKQVIEHYHSLWQVEQAFRMSKHDLRARPIFHYTHDAIRAHLLICFMALMIGKFIEIKTGCSLRYIRDLLWQVHEIQLRDSRSGKERIVRTPISPELEQLLNKLDIKNTH